MMSDVEFEKTHNLSVLIDLCADRDSAFHGLMDFAEALTPFATLYRYPEEVEPAEPEEVALAIKMTREILDFVAIRITAG